MASLSDPYPADYSNYAKWRIADIKQELNRRSAEYWGCSLKCEYIGALDWNDQTRGTVPKGPVPVPILAAPTIKPQQYKIPAQYEQSRWNVHLHPNLGQSLRQRCLDDPYMEQMHQSVLKCKATPMEKDSYFYDLDQLNKELVSRDASASSGNCVYGTSSSFQPCRPYD